MINKPHKSLKEKIFDVAHKQGLSDIGFTNPKLDPEEFKNFKDFINKRYHGQMYWLNNNIGWRENPKLMWENVETIIVFAENYYKGGYPLADINIKHNANISIYARGDDYHNVLKKN